MPRQLAESSRRLASPFERAAALNALGLLNKSLARFEVAKRRYERALSIVQVEPESLERSRAMATLYHNLGGIEHALGHFRSAEALARTGIDIRRALPHEDRSDLAADLSALAAIVEGDDRYDESEMLFREALALLGEVNPPNELEIAVATGGLGVIQVRRGRPEAAIEPLQRAASLKRRVLGCEHPDLALTLNNLAVAHDRLGASGEAVALFGEAVEICTAALGANHPRTRRCRANLQQPRRRMP